MRHVLIIFLKMYQWLVSPIVHTLCGPGFGCRYEESCSSFAIRSVKERGAWFGGRQSLRRVFRCQNVFGIVAVIFCALPLGAVASPTLGDGPAWISGWQLPSHESALEDLLHKKEVLQLGFDQSEFLYLKNVQSPWRTQGDSKVWRFEDENVILERQVTPDEKTGTWGFNAKGVFKKTSKLPRPKHLFLSVESVFNDQDVDAQDRQLVWYVQQNIERQGLQKTFTTRSSSEGLRWVGFQNRYFAVALLPEGAGPWSGLMQSLYEEQSAGGRASLVTPVQGDAFDVRFRVFFGPQDLSLLQKADKSLDILVDFGWFTIIAYPLLKAMKWFYAFVGNYGIAIILLTLLIKLLTYPLTYKSMKSMKEMAKLQPEIQKLKE